MPEYRVVAVAGQSRSERDLDRAVLGQLDRRAVVVWENWFASRPVMPMLATFSVTAPLLVSVIGTGLLLPPPLAKGMQR